MKTSDDLLTLGGSMSIGKQGELQGTLWVAYDDIPKGQGHAFYDHLQRVLHRGRFDSFAEELCTPFYAKTMGRPSIPPGRYFRMLLVGYFEGLDSERGICWRCADSLSLREFLQLELSESVPDHSSLSRIRRRLPLEAHHEVFVHVLGLLSHAGLLQGKRLGIDASTMEANAAMRSIVRHDTGEGYKAMLEQLARESGIETPTLAQLAAFDRKRRDKRVSNAAPVYDRPSDLVADKGYHSREVLKNLDGAFRSRISVPTTRGFSRWRGDHEARRAVYANRARVASGKGKALLRKRGELVERTFAHCLDSGGMRRAHLRGTENIEKRYQIHVTGFNLGLLMRSLLGVGTPKGWAEAQLSLVLLHVGVQYFLLILFCGSDNLEGTEFIGGIAISWSQN